MGGNMVIQTMRLFTFAFFVGIFSFFGNSQSILACSPGMELVDAGVSISPDGGKTFVHRTTADGLGSDRIFGIFASGQNVYVATNKGLSVSFNGGASFVGKTTLDGLGSDFVRGGVFADGQNVYVGTNGGLAISTDGGVSFINRTALDGLGGNEVSAVFADGQNVYVGTNAGLSISTDGGVSFVNKTISNGLGSNRIRGISVKGKTLYVATWGRVLEPLPPVNGGLSFSIDEGATFKNIPVDFYNFGYSLLSGVFTDERNIYVVKHRNAFVSADGGSSFTGLGDLSEDIRFFGMDAFFANSSHVYVAMPQGLFVSTDGAKKFTQQTAQIFPRWAKTRNPGWYPQERVHAIFADGQRVYVAAIKLKRFTSAVCDDFVSRLRPNLP